MALRLIPKTDDGPFPYEMARQLLLNLEGLVFTPKDFGPMLAAGRRMGWPDELIRANEDLARKGRCFDFAMTKAPFLRGSLFEDNVFFSFSSRGHRDGCMPEIERLASTLDVRIHHH